MNKTQAPSAKQGRREKQQRREAERLLELKRKRRTTTGLVIGSAVLVVAIIGFFIWVHILKAMVHRLLIVVQARAPLARLPMLL
ncbi:hypothetical protein [Dictyobacter kobayashii]|uniref:Uncharacterized protein n=1 Tax=Dictyobacter kobayashii TaxID=2014872 RepID=A0A402AQE8_9CHLR|nr:hypothetical protein [Dictyobacter kobayashii]GCE21336.1 hypothetical protein KDK_51360 [Dictyobacter kobayashii]